MDPRRKTLRREAVLEAVARTEWDAIPGSGSLFTPAVIAPAFAALASATSENEAFIAVRPLANGGLRHDHSGILHPGAVVAAPLLLDLLAELDSDAVLPAFRALLYALLRDSGPWFQEPYAIGPTGGEQLLCCAIADTVRARSALLTSRGQCGLNVLQAANEHWSFTVAEVAEVERPGGTLALGRLTGMPERKYAPCELRRPHRQIFQLTARVNVLHSPADPSTGQPTGQSGEALLRIYDIEPDRLQVGDILAAPCHDSLS